MLTAVCRRILVLCAVGFAAVALNCSSPSDSDPQVQSQPPTLPAWLCGHWRSQCFAFQGNRHEEWVLDTARARQTHYYCGTAFEMVSQAYSGWRVTKDTFVGNISQGVDVVLRFRIDTYGSPAQDSFSLEKAVDTGMQWIRFGRVLQ
jgi:hypothetical protein